MVLCAGAWFLKRHIREVVTDDIYDSLYFIADGVEGLCLVIMIVLLVARIKTFESKIFLHVMEAILVVMLGVYVVEIVDWATMSQCSRNLIEKGILYTFILLAVLKLLYILCRPKKIS